MYNNVKCFNNISRQWNTKSTGIYIKTNSPLIEYQLMLFSHKRLKIIKPMFEYYKFLQYKKVCTEEHEKSLRLLLNILPFDIFEIIDSYIDKTNEYLYYIPFNLLNNDIDSFINFSRFIDICINIKTEDNINEGTVKCQS